MGFAFRSDQLGFSRIYMLSSIPLSSKGTATEAIVFARAKRESKTLDATIARDGVTHDGSGKPRQATDDY